MAPQDDKPIKLNGAFFVLCTILRLVAASAAEAELGALFLNAKQAKIFKITLEEMGHPQPPTPVHIDNSTTVGIVNNTIKRQKSRSMEIKYWWLQDQEAQNFSHFTNIQDKRTWATIHQSTTLATYINMSAHITCTLTTHQQSYHELKWPELNEGVMKS